MSYTPIVVEVTIVTEKAIRIYFDGEPLWIPKSVIAEEDLEDISVGEEVEINVKTWFAEKEGLE